MHKHSSDSQTACHQSGAFSIRVLSVAAAVLAATLSIAIPSDARTHSKKSAPVHHAEVSHRSSSHHAAPAHVSRSVTVTSSRHGRSTSHTELVARTVKGKHGRSHVVYETKKETAVASHRGRHQKAVIVTHEIVKVVKVAAPPKTRYAYPLSFFMMHPPEFDRSNLSDDVSNRVSRSFHQGYADNYAARSLVRAGLVSYHPLRGGIFWRREPIKYIIMHSTETGIPLSAERVIESWSSMGLRHPGAQYVVERDGTIFQAVDPDLGTVHINIFKTLPGINNDNSIGIEMNHTGRQDYPAAQREAVVKLVAYLQERYKIADDNVITHRYAQQGDHTDPVNFDWDGFISAKNSFRNRAIAYKVKRIKDDVKEWNVTTTAVTPDSVTTTSTTVTPVAPIREIKVAPPPEASTYLQPHKTITETPVYKTTTTTTTVTKTPAAVPEVNMTLYPPVTDSDPESVTTTTVAPVPVQTKYMPVGVSPLNSTTRFMPVSPINVGPKIVPAIVTPSSSSSSSSTVVAPSVAPKFIPNLRGPIEMAPGSAPGLNIAPTPGL